MANVTVIHARLVHGKYEFGIAGPDHHDNRDSLVFRIEGDGDGEAPRSAPSPATRAEMDAWVERLRQAGYRVTQLR